jgi:hypothetical protein
MAAAGTGPWGRVRAAPCHSGTGDGDRAAGGGGLASVRGGDHTSTMPRERTNTARLSFEEAPPQVRPCDVPGCTGGGVVTSTYLTSIPIGTGAAAPVMFSNSEIPYYATPTNENLCIAVGTGSGDWTYSVVGRYE